MIEICNECNNITERDNFHCNKCGECKDDHNHDIEGICLISN